MKGQTNGALRANTIRTGESLLAQARGTRLARDIESLNILLITFDPPRNVGGIEGRGNNYTKYLRKEGHFVEVISFSPEGDFSAEELHGAPLYNFPSSSRQAWKTLGLTKKEIIKNSIDAIFLLSGALTLYGMLLLFYASRKSIKTLVLYYGKDILSAKNTLSGSIALRISPRLTRKIAVNSHYSATLLPKKFGNKIDVLYPAVDPSILDEFEELLERDTGVDAPDPGHKTILFVGRLVKRKGVDDLLRAFRIVLRQFPNVSLEIVGDGPESYSLQGLTADLDISRHVKFFGSLSGRTLYQRYKNCDVFVMPSRASRVDVEGFGTVFLEAGIFSKPCIGTFSGGIPEAIKNGITGLLVPEGDIENLSKSLERLISDPDLAQRLGNNAKKVVSTEFTWEHSTRRLLSILET